MATWFIPFRKKVIRFSNNDYIPQQKKKIKHVQTGHNSRNPTSILCIIHLSTRRPNRCPVSVDAHLVTDSRATSSINDDKEGFGQRQGHSPARYKSKKTRKNNSGGRNYRGDELQVSLHKLLNRVLFENIYIVHHSLCRELRLHEPSFCI